MISVMTWIHNRAHLFKWCLEGIAKNLFGKFHPLQPNEMVELNVLDDGSTDGLDDLLLEYSKIFHSVKKWMWDPKKTLVPRRFNCPAEPYNILVKLCSGPYILKTDPEMVLLDSKFLETGVAILNKSENAIVMPFPYHCYDFEIYDFEDIRIRYKRHHYNTHITRENASTRMIYYQAMFRKDSYLNLGGIDERFASGIGNEDDHFLDWWRKVYGQDNFIPLVDSPAIHLFHGGMASGPQGVPQELYSWVEQNERLRRGLVNTRPNEGREWGRIYDHITLTQWEDGKKIVDMEPIEGGVHVWI